MVMKYAYLYVRIAAHFLKKTCLSTNTICNIGSWKVLSTSTSRKLQWSMLAKKTEVRSTVDCSLRFSSRPKMRPFVLVKEFCIIDFCTPLTFRNAKSILLNTLGEIHLHSAICLWKTLLLKKLVILQVGES